jgi:hypothetical protein
MGLALTSILGLALCASIGAGRAQAQGKMSKQKTRAARTMDDQPRMARMEDEEELLPTAPSYPNAAPGTLDLNYWTDVARRHMKAGSATEARMDRMRDRDRARAANTMSEEDAERLPTAPGYPMAGPGAVDLNYWTDVTGKHMKPGSASEARMEKMNERDRARMANTMHEEDEEDLLPTAPSYPAAAPGSVDLNYWTDVARKHMKPGSASEARMERMKEKNANGPRK